MAADYLDQYGIRWRGPHIKLSSMSRRIICCIHAIGNIPVWEHRKVIMQTLWPNWQWHDWCDEWLKAFSDSTWTTWVGPAGAGKSAFAAMCAVEYWFELPEATAVILCSTSVEMLKMRVWNEVIRLYMAIPEKIEVRDESGKLLETLNIGKIGRPIATQTKIMWEPGDDKHGLTGVAVAEGPVEQVVSNHLGVHTKRVLLVMDEMQAVRPAILKAAASNMSKNEEFKLLGVGNPDDVDSLLGKESEPIGGWASINIETDHRWKTLGLDPKKGGLCVFTDGRKSPADKSPEERKRLPFLINSDQIAQHLYRCRGNTDDPDYWTQSIGFFPPSGTKSTVLDAAIIERFHCRERAIWTRDFTRGAGLDPAFSFGGGDKKVLRFFKFGQIDEVVDGTLTSRWMVELGKTIMVPVKASSDVPLDYQIAYFCKEQCEAEGIKPENFGSDSTGIGRGLRSIFDMVWGPIIGVEFGGAPSERRINSTSGKTAKEQYDYRASELNMAVREFAMSDSLRGLDAESSAEFCLRKVTYENKKQKVEKKSDLKKRINRSPDCFIAGTMIHTQRGEIPIETVTTDDYALTPFGFSRVVFVHHTTTTELQDVELSNGRSLIGKPAHKVLSMGQWLRMDALSIDIEVESVFNQPIWKFLEALFTRARPTGFKALIDTIPRGTERRDFFIESFGLSILGLFQKACVSTIRMATGQITGLKTFASWIVANIHDCIAVKISPTPAFVEGCSSDLSEREKLQKNGILPPRGSRGIKSTRKRHGERECVQNGPLNASNAGVISKQPISQMSDFVELAVLSARAVLVFLWSVLVRSAVKYFKHANMLGGAPVRVVATRKLSTEPVGVLNLTLLEENAYYANGVLVQNCADAVAICVEVARQRGAIASINSVSSRPSVENSLALKQSDDYYSDENYILGYDAA